MNIQQLAEQKKPENNSSVFSQLQHTPNLPKSAHVSFMALIFTAHCDGGEANGFQSDNICVRWWCGVVLVMGNTKKWVSMRSFWKVVTLELSIIQLMQKVKIQE